VKLETLRQDSTWTKHLLYDFHCIHTLSPRLMTLFVLLPSSHQHLQSFFARGNILGRLDLQLGGALRRALVYCTTLGSRSGMRAALHRPSLQTASRFLHSTPNCHPSIVHDACVNTCEANWHHLAPVSYRTWQNTRRHACLVETSLIL